MGDLQGAVKDPLGFGGVGCAGAEGGGQHGLGTGEEVCHVAVQPASIRYDVRRWLVWIFRAPFHAMPRLSFKLQVDIQVHYESYIASHATYEKVVV